MRSCFPDDELLAHNLKKYVTAYSKGLHGASDFRERVNRCTGLSPLLTETWRFFAEPRQAA